MRVLINASILGNKLNGVSIYTVEIIRRLIEKFDRAGIDYYVYCYPNNHLNFVPRERISEITLSKYWEKFLGPFRSFHRLYWNTFVLSDIAKKFDLIYCPTSHGTPFAYNQVLTIHDLISLEYPRQHIFQYFYFRFLLPHIIKRSFIVAISNYTMGEIIKKFKVQENRLKTIYNGADHLNISVNTRNDGILAKYELSHHQYFLTVGANYPHKNISRLIEVAFMHRATSYKFVIVGISGKYKRTIEKKIHHMHLKNIVLLEYVDNDELSLLYQRSCANIYISLSEGFGFPPIEAAHYNVISIVSNETCLPEIYGDSVLYVNPYDVEDIAKKVGLFITGDIDVASFDDRLNKLKHKYLWESTSVQIFNLLSNYIMLKKA